jgi:hypothetical protein
VKRAAVLVEQLAELGEGLEMAGAACSAGCRSAVPCAWAGHYRPPAQAASVNMNGHRYCRVRALRSVLMSDSRASSISAAP